MMSFAGEEFLHPEKSNSPTSVLFDKLVIHYKFDQLIIVLYPHSCGGERDVRVRCLLLHHHFMFINK